MIRKYWQVAACAAMACVFARIAWVHFARTHDFIGCALAVLAFGAWVSATFRAGAYARRYR